MTTHPEPLPASRRLAALEPSMDPLAPAAPTLREGHDRLPFSERLALSVEEAGMLLGISRDLAYDLVSRNELPSVRLGRRVVVPRHALEETLHRLTDAAGLVTEDRV